MRRSELENERKRLQIEINYLEDDLLRCKDYHKQEKILKELNYLRRSLGRLR